MSGKDFLKSHVLSCRRKLHLDWEDATSSGRAFQVFGPATAWKARLPTVDRLTGSYFKLFCKNQRPFTCSLFTCLLPIIFIVVICLHKTKYVIRTKVWKHVGGGSAYLGLKGQGLEQAWFFNLVFYEGTGWQVANEIAKPQVSTNSNNSSTDCSLHCKKTATGNGNFKFATGNRN